MSSEPGEGLHEPLALQHRGAQPNRPSPHGGNDLLEVLYASPYPPGVRPRRRTLLPFQAPAKHSEIEPNSIELLLQVVVQQAGNAMSLSLLRQGKLRGQQTCLFGASVHPCLERPLQLAQLSRPLTERLLVATRLLDLIEAPQDKGRHVGHHANARNLARLERLGVRGPAQEKSPQGDLFGNQGNDEKLAARTGGGEILPNGPFGTVRESSLLR